MNPDDLRRVYRARARRRAVGHWLTALAFWALVGLSVIALIDAAQIVWSVMR